MLSIERVLSYFIFAEKQNLTFTPIAQRSLLQGLNSFNNVLGGIALSRIVALDLCAYVLSCLFNIKYFSDNGTFLIVQNHYSDILYKKFQKRLRILLSNTNTSIVKQIATRFLQIIKYQRLNITESIYNMDQKCKKLTPPVTRFVSFLY